MRYLSVEFDRDDVTYYAGEQITGTVKMYLEKKTKCKNVTATLGWYAHGHGNEATNELLVADLFSGELEPGEYTYRFAFELPPGPYTYHGHYMNVDWYVEATADIPWASDPKADEDFVLLPCREVQPPPPEESAASTTSNSGLGLIIFGGLLLVLSLAFGGFILIEEEEFGGFCCGLIGAIIGGAMLYGGVHRFLATQLVGHVTFNADPWPVHPGTAFMHTIRFTPKFAMTTNSVQAILTGKEVVIEGYGSDQTTHTNVIYEQTIELAEQGTFPKGEPATLRANFDVPDYAPCSVSCAYNSVIWEVKTVMDIPNWPDWEDTHTIVVAPDYDKAPSRDAARGEGGGGIKTASW